MRYMHKSESILENEKYRIFGDFEVQTNHLILVRRQNLEIISKKKKRKLSKQLSLLSLSENQMTRKNKLVLGPYQRIKKL